MCSVCVRILRNDVVIIRHFLFIIGVVSLLTTDATIMCVSFQEMMVAYSELVNIIINSDILF